MSIEDSKRPGPAGSPPEPCWEARGAGPRQGDLLTTPRTARWADGGTGERQRRSDELERQAALAVAMATEKLPSNPTEAKRLARRAAELLGEAEEVREGRREPRPNSDSEQRCPTCDGKKMYRRYEPRWGMTMMNCPDCKGTGVSGACLPND